MKVDLIIGKTNLECFEKVVDILKVRDRSLNHIIITPDRNALNVEEMVIDMLGEECMADFSVSTFSRFANNVIKKSNNGLDRKILSKSACVSIIKNIVMNNKDSLLYYKNSIELAGFCSEIYETLCMFKSCNVLPGDMIETKNEYLNKKLKDIKLIYDQFELFLKEKYTDSFNRLIYASTLINHEWDKTNFYFVGFEDFTFQMYQIIVALIKNANSVSVATVSNLMQGLNNKQLFVNNIYLNMVDICKQIGVYYNQICVNDTSELKNNLLSYNPYKIDSNMVDIVYNQYDFDNKKQEVEFLAKKIKQLIIDKKIDSFDNIEVCASSISLYKEHINSVFSQVGIPFYIDQNNKLSEHFLFRFVFDYLYILSNQYEISTVLSFLNNPLCGETCSLFEYQKFVENYGIRFEALVNRNKISNKILIPENVVGVYNVLQNWFGNVNDFSEFNSVSEIVKAIFDSCVNMNFDDSVRVVYNKLVSQKQIIEARTLKKAYENLQIIFNDLCEVFSNETIELKSFVELLITYVEGLSIAQPPIQINTVFVGDAKDSYFKPVDYLFILGASDGELPLYSQDLGIISDSEIIELNKNYKLSPTIDIINKRKKFKIYELLFIARKEVNLFYVSATPSGEECYPSIFLRSLKDLGVLNVYSGKDEFDVSNLLLKNNSRLFSNNDLYFARNNFISAIKNWDVFNDNLQYRDNINYLFTILKNFNVDELIKNANYFNKVNNLSKQSNHFFNNNRVSISQFESFYKCPYMHFCTYGLKLKESKVELDNRIYGNLIHEFLKSVVPKLVACLKNKSEFKLDEVCESVFKKILSQKQFVNIVQNPLNEINIKALKEECVRVVKSFIYQFENSRFLPIDNGYELSFDNIGSSVEFKVGDKVIKLKGIIDRVDKCENSFRVIDYKTGSDKFNDYTELYAGKKIQLIVYMDIFAKSNKALKPVGAFYLPIKNTFSLGKESELYMLNGIIENSIENILNMDLNLENNGYASKIIDIKTKNDGAFASNNTYNNMCISEEQICVLRNFVNELMKSAVEKIKNGEIDVYPLEINNNKTCEYCKFRGICCFDISFNNRTRKVEKVSTVDELKNKFYGEKKTWNENI